MLRTLVYKVFSLGFNRLEITTCLRGEWPVCARCVRSSARLRDASRAIVLVGVLCVLGMVLCKVLGLGQAAVVAFAVAVFPIWLPIGLLVASLLRRRATTFIRCRPIVSTDSIELDAHPDFVAAITAPSHDDVA